ncbi:MAG: hemolysin family protein [SAR202 cluster bacterium]|nr:hemolysin family protein [SAR202 cluster bacterium]HJO59767.1 hemolysin family protein [SAR202 cluster bacterium]
MSTDTAVSIVLIGVFLLLSAFFSSSEAAFLSLQRTRLNYLVTNNIPGAKRVHDMVTNTERLLSTILLGNNLVNVAFTAVVTALAVKWLKEGPVAVAAATIVGTGLLLIFGEIIPKSLAVKKSERVSFLYARPLKLIELSLYPLILFLQWLSRTTQSIFGKEQEEVVTEGEILSMIDLGEAEGTVEPNEAEMLENVFRFGDTQVREIMTPRTEIIVMDRGTTLNDFLNIYSEHSHTRFPIYKDTNENIVGIISAKDVLRILSTKGINGNDSVTDVIRDAHFVPETKWASELFEELRHAGNQMAICLDEYGGLAGLVTLKRLTELIVGKVGEEGESPEIEYENIRPNVFQIEGGMDIADANSEMDLELPEGEYETIAGFVLDQIGEIPKINDEFEYEDMTFRILEMDRFRVESLLITRNPNPMKTPKDSKSDKILDADNTG